MSQEAQEQLFNLNGKQYKVSSIPQEAIPLFSDLGIIDQELQKKTVEINIVKLAQNSLTDKFAAFIEVFEEVVPEDVPEVSEAPVNNV